MFNSGGRVVAIKKVPRNDLIVNNTVRKEVMQIRYLTVLIRYIL